MDKGQGQEQAVKLTASEGTGKEGWQRVWFDSQSAKEVTRDTLQELCQSALPPCFCFKCTPCLSQLCLWGQRDGLVCAEQMLSCVILKRKIVLDQDHTNVWARR